VLKVPQIFIQSHVDHRQFLRTLSGRVLPTGLPVQGQNSGRGRPAWGAKLLHSFPICCRSEAAFKQLK